MRLVPLWSLRSPRKAFPAFLILFFLMLLFMWVEHGRPYVPFLYDGNRAEVACPLDVGYLRQDRYRLSGDIILHRQCIRATADSSINRSAIADMDESIFGRTQALNLGASCHQWEQMTCDPIDLAIPPPYPSRRYNDFIFGVATSFDRLVDSVPQLSHWLAHSEARLVALIVDVAEREADIGRLINFYKDHGVELIIAWPTDDQLSVNQQHFTIIRDLVRHATEDTKWVGIIDDDTFFPSLYPVAEALSAYDPNVPAYFGGLSDNLGAIQAFGLMAYGGAGALLSMPLTRELEPHIDTCLMQSDSSEGDALLKNCIYSQTSTRLTIIPDLNQLDMVGDVSGFYESGRLPLSLHHWKTWHSAPVDQIAKAAHFCGTCILQRWRFGRDTLLTNGYSVSVYSQGVDQIDLDRTEATMEQPEQYEWSYGPMREKLGDSEKKSFRLVNTDKFEKSLRQVYIHRGKGSRDEVLELWWYWKDKLM